MKINPLALGSIAIGIISMVYDEIVAEKDREAMKNEIKQELKAESNQNGESI